jgi:pectinesterase
MKEILFFSMLLVSLGYPGWMVDGSPVQPTKIVVDANGKGDFKTIQEAVNSVRDLSGQRVMVYIKKGTYHEKIVVPSWKTNISFIGEDRDSTVITNDDYSGKPYPHGPDGMGKDKFNTFTSYTVLVQGNGFSAENLTIQNTAGRVGQAVALHVEGDRVIIKNCKLLGNQDTLYVATGNSRQYYLNCTIEGTTDFIFGEATVVFQHCTIKSLLNSFVTAAATTARQPYGFVLMDCKLAADSGVTKAFLGRPWRPYARTVYIHCELGSHIVPEGWNPWKGDALFPDKEKTAYYAEYENTGPGASANGRVPWAKQLNADEAKRYTLLNILGGADKWDPLAPAPANLDETKVPPYTEPDPLVATDGHRVTTVKEWERVQRPAIYGMFEKNVYGRMPAKTLEVTCSVRKVDSLALDGMAIRKELTLYFSSADTAARLNMVLYLPRMRPDLPRKGPARVPVFVGYSFEGNATVETSSQWPLKEILSRGYGVATAWYWDIEPDRADGWQTGIRSRLAGALQIEPNEWSAIGAWAWGLERMADYLKTDKSVDAGKLIVIGHSRLGKAALWAGASYPGFALVVSNESGEGGAALSKRDYGETVGIINARFPWWFAPAYKQYSGNTDALPLDQHMLLSLIAPRPLYVASAEGDQWSDPKGEFLGAAGAGPVYQLFKEKGVGVDSMPPVGHPAGDFIRYHIRTGKHDITLYDWQQYMDFADRHFKRRK